MLEGVHGLLRVKPRRTRDEFARAAVGFLTEDSPLLALGLTVRVRRDAASDMGMSVGTLTQSLRTLYAGRRVTYPETLYNCGVPQSAKAAADLRRALIAVSERAR